ncbi:hypothetical protein N7528_008985 [Penicillium herquei]|nr:hypothetical protein N7528_008985 [Penicillium herquei]
MSHNHYAVVVAAIASLGTFLYVSAIYIAGEAVGAILQILIADRLGRIRFMQLACVLVTIGSVIQTASINMGMFLAGRVLAGIAVGALSGTVPVYILEISPPKTRGFIGGLSGVGLALGTMCSNWVGYACGYASYGTMQWRLPLALQVPWGVIMLISLFTIMPDSPRQLIQQGKLTEAHQVLRRIWNDSKPEEITKEFALMKAQIEYENQREIPSYRDIFRIYRHRFLLGFCADFDERDSLSVGYLPTFTAILYKSLGANSTLQLALAAVWGTTAFISNVIGVRYIADNWGRRKMLLIGVASTMAAEIYSAIMQHFFQNSANSVGKAFSILGIYLVAVVYYGLINSTTWLYGAEVLPMSVRSRIMGVAAASHYIVNVGLTEAGPSAFGSIQENYYYVFVGCCAVYLAIIYLYYPETKQKALEEIAAAFGDVVIEAEDQNGGKAAIKSDWPNEEPRSSHIEGV